MRDISVVTLVFAMLVFAAGCSSIEESELPAPEVKEVGDRIILVDQTGAEWDVTEAVREHGLRPDLWQFGLGVNAILPILEPQFWEPGDRGYLGPDETHIVIATTINGDSRAYQISHLNAHEVVDEQFGDTYVAVGW